MTPEAQRIAIAEACGWTNIDKYLGNEPLPFTREFLGGTDDGLPEGDDTLGHEIKRLPDYLNDLNAVHEAEKLLLEDDEGNERCGNYLAYLRNVMGVATFSWQLPFATAAQRCEALLRTLGRWQDGLVKDGKEREA